MSENQMKVTDKRMFTPDGELREEYRGILDAEGKAAESESSSDEAQEAARAEPPRETPPAQKPAAPKDYPSGATFDDLIGLLAQSASVYLQQASHPQRGAEHLDLAKLHVDLLAILKDKTEGHLSPGEKQLLDDALYQLRMAVVQRG